MTDPARWLLLIHQIPPQPSYFRAKVGKRLQKLGAMSIKNTVYVMPHSEQAQEDLQWVAREIIAEGGEATLCGAHFIEGMNDAKIEALFQSARDADFDALTEDAVGLATKLGERSVEVGRDGELGAEVARLRKRAGEIAAIDFFGAPRRHAAEQALAAAERLLTTPAPGGTRRPPLEKRSLYAGRTWITRKGVQVDRIASAWLIRRFIDPKATFKFVAPHGYRLRPKEVRFDMFDAEFTHEGDSCTFEVLLQRFGLEKPGLGHLGEIVHELDVKDAKFAQDEAPGIGAILAAIALAHRDDAKRLERGFAVLDDLMALLERKRGSKRR